MLFRESVSEYRSKDSVDISRQCTELLPPPEGATVQLFRSVNITHESVNREAQTGNWHSVIRDTIRLSNVSKCLTMQ